MNTFLCKLKYWIERKSTRHVLVITKILFLYRIYILNFAAIRKRINASHIPQTTMPDKKHENRKLENHFCIKKHCNLSITHNMSFFHFSGLFFSEYSWRRSTYSLPSPALIWLPCQLTQKAFSLLQSHTSVWFE